MTVIAKPTSPSCPRCGSAMPGDAPAGLCPRCLLSDGFGAQSEGDFRLRTGHAGTQFDPPTIEELAAEFPHLEFVQLLGSGGMGAVYLAKQIRLDRRVAVKILPPDLADDPAFAERFLREARALARLSHPNIVGVYDFGQTPGGLYYFLMEYIEGPTLRQVVANRTTEPKQALEIVRQVCDALQFAHDKGVVHRDVKPENILLDAQGRVKIADFGLAKLLGIAEPQPGSPAAGSLTHTRQAMGTPHYMAPEQIAGSRGVDHRADIYSLGVVFYELLTGELPVGRFAPPSKKVQVDVRLDEVVLRSLEAEPAQRYQRASDVKTDVEMISSVPPRRHDDRFPAAMRFVREASAGTGRAVRSMLEPAGPGQLSKFVIAAIIWAAAVPLALLCLVLAETFDRHFQVLTALFVTIGFVVALPAITAPIGTTLLGLWTVREVRRSPGTMTGMVPGLAVALLFPLLLIGVLLPWFLGALSFHLVFHKDEPALYVAFVFGVPLALWLGVRIGRAAWRRVTVGLPPELIERELSVIPSSVRNAVRAVGDWIEQMGLSPETLFGRTARPADQTADQTENESVAHDSIASAPATPRISLKAIVGACWAAMLPLGALMFLFVENTPRGDGVYGIAVGLLGLFSVPALTAPVATTLLGWSAVGDIRRSAGKLTGLRLAVFDGLCFPLLLLGAVVAVPVAALLVGIAWKGFSVYLHDYGRLHVIVLALIVLGIVGVFDAVIAFIVWRRVKASMPAATEIPPAAPPTTEPESWLEPVAPRRHRDLVIAGVAIAVALTLVGLQVLYENGFPRWRSHRSAIVARNSAAHATAKALSDGGATLSDGIITEEERNRGWRMTPDGPEFLPGWSASVSGDTTAESITAALQHVYADYERVLEDHTTAAFEDDAVVFTIEPFPKELDRLTNEFWTRVDPLLHVEQQKILRYNFPLRYSQKHRFRDSHRHFVLPIGDGRWTIRIEKSGQWYRWSATYPNSPAITYYDRPELLPSHIRRFQYEFERLTSLRKEGLAFDPQRLPLVAPRPSEALATSPPTIPGDAGVMGIMMPYGPAGAGMEGMMGMGGMDMYGEREAMGMMPGIEMGGMAGMGGPMTGDSMMSEPPGLPTDPRLLKTHLEQLGVAPPNAAAIAEAVNEIDAEYETRLDAHTIVHGDGVVRTFEVAPFASEIGALERRFWEQVDPLLTTDQQRMLRENLRVGKLPTSRAVIYGQASAGLMPLGRHGGMTLKIDRVGLWYRWDLHLRTRGDNAYDLDPQESPSLPAWLRRFQERYDELVELPAAAGQK